MTRYKDSYKTNADQQKLFVREWLPEEDPLAVVLYVHGLGSHSGRMDHWAERYTAKQIGFIAYDQRGHGKADGKRGHPKHVKKLIEDTKMMVEMLREEFPEIPVILYGHSMGGNVAINYVISTTKTVDALITTSPWLKLTNPPSKALTITPVRTFVRYETDTVRMPLFTAYFPDLMSILQHHIPEKRNEGVENTLDFFRKGLYQGKNVTNLYLQDRVFSWELIESDTMQATVIGEGIFVDPRNRVFQGNDSDGWADRGPLQPVQIPDLQEVSYAKYYKQTIDLKMRDNWPLYLPVDSVNGMYNINGVIIGGLYSGLFIPYDSDDDFPVSMRDIIDKLNYESTVFTYNEFGEEEEVIFSEPLFIEKLMVNELAFFDHNDREIHREPMEIIPMVALYEGYELPRHEAVCRLPFRAAGFREHLHQAMTFQLSSSSEETYLSFFQNMKYKPESTMIQPVSIKEAGSVIGSDYWNEKMLEMKVPHINPLRGKQLKLSIRELFLSNGEDEGTYYYEVLDNILYNNDGTLAENSYNLPANYQLFFPQHEYNGLRSLFDLIKEGVLKRGMFVYKYNEQARLDTLMGWNEISDIMHPFDSAYADVVSDDEYLQTDIPSSIVQKYKILELASGKQAIPVAVAPDFSGICEYFNYTQPCEEKYSFWFPFTKPFREFLMDQELLRFSGETSENYYDLLFNGEYVGKLIEERPISREEADQLIEIINE
ncbi:alpha/beta fold hydrolase [Bacteroidota bacterium]